MSRLGREKQSGRVCCFSCLLVCLDILPILTHAEEAPPSAPLLWTREFGSEVKSVYCSSGSTLLVTTKDTMYALDKISGTTAWQRSREKSSEFVPSTLDKPRFVLISDKEPFPLRPNMSYAEMDSYGLRYTAIDPNNGQTSWSTAPLGEVAGLGCYITPKPNLLLVCLTDGDGTPWLSAVDIQTGSPVWEQREFFGKNKPDLHRNRFGYTTIEGNPQPLFDTDSTFITFFARDLIQRHDLSTGRLIWHCKVGKKYRTEVSWPYASMLLSTDSQTVYVPCQRHLWAVSTRDGSLEWPKPAKIQGSIAQIEDLAEGVLVRNVRLNLDVAERPAITLLDHEIGRAVWQYEFSKQREFAMSNFIVNEDTAYVWCEDELIRFGISTGASEVLNKDMVKKSGTDIFLFSRDEGLLILDGQSVLLVGYDGQTRYHTYYQPPRRSRQFEEQIIFTVAGVAGAALTNVIMGFPWNEGLGTTLVNSSLSPSKLTYSLSYWNKDFVYMTADRVGTSLRTAANSDTPPSSSSTKKKLVSGIVKINLVTGQTDGELALNDNSPTYCVDPDDAKLFYVVRDDKDLTRNRRTLAAYAF